VAGLAPNRERQYRGCCHARLAPTDVDAASATHTAVVAATSTADRSLMICKKIDAARMPSASTDSTMPTRVIGAIPTIVQLPFTPLHPLVVTRTPARPN